MIPLHEAYGAMENLFGIELKGNEGVPYFCDLANETPPAPDEQVMYYGKLRILGRPLDENATPQPLSGNCKLFVGGEKTLDQTVLNWESQNIGEVLFTSFELQDCRGSFGGYKLTVKTVAP